MRLEKLIATQRVAGIERVARPRRGYHTGSGASARPGLSRSVAEAESSTPLEWLWGVTLEKNTSPPGMETRVSGRASEMMCESGGSDRIGQ